MDLDYKIVFTKRKTLTLTVERDRSVVVSCTPSDNVLFNWRLIKAPMFVIDYVVVHELAHLIEQNHTPRFWNIIRAQIPSMGKAKVWLQRNGALLEQEL